MSFLKTNKIFLKKEDIETEICKIIEDKINVYNTAALYNTSILYSLSSLSKLSLCYIERCFTIVADSHNFKELDYIAVVKILSSNELNLDSELEVFSAADEWLNHNVKERSKYARYVLSNIRLSLLSEHALRYILNEMSPTYKTEEFVATVNEFLENKKLTDCNRSERFGNVRFCSQNQFNIILFAGYEYESSRHVEEVFSVDLRNLTNVKALPKMRKTRQSPSVSLKDEVYVVGGDFDYFNPIQSIDKYSSTNNTWERVADMYDNRENFCACSFMSNLYIIGGCIEDDTNSCVKFNTKDRSWEKITAMNEIKCYAACTVLAGRIVVSGGCNNPEGSLSTVEAYDHVADSWSFMPNMIQARFEHKSVAVKNKLFVVGGWETTTCEVFDLTCNKFVLLKPPPTTFFDDERNFDDAAEVVSTGSSLAVFVNETTSVLFYDVENGEWSKESCEVTRRVEHYCCVKLPQL